MVKMTSCARAFKDHVTSLCNLNDRESALVLMLAVDMASSSGGPTQKTAAPPGSTRRSDPERPAARASRSGLPWTRAELSERQKSETEEDREQFSCVCSC